TQVGNRGRLLDVQFARTSVIPETVGYVGILLNLAQHDAAANRVYRMRRSEVRLARAHRHPVEQILNLAGASGLAQTLPADRFAKTQCNGGARLRVQDVPHFGFAAWSVFAVAWVHLHRQ